MSTISVPGKVFLIGEYSVLQGGRALLAALRPGYHFEFGLGGAAHSDSPLGRYADEVGNPLIFSEAESSMRPGFGSSTAELIAGVLYDVERLPETKRLWAWYKEQVPNASGADLAVQMEAHRNNRALFEFANGEAVPFQDAGIAAHFQVFQAHASQKLKTHEVLQSEVPELNIAKLDALALQVKYAFEAGDLEKLSALNEFADEMHALHIETPFAHEVRMTFKKIDGIVAVKGCGGGLNDVFLVVARDKNFNYGESAEVKAIIKKFGLTHLGGLQEMLW